MHEKWEMKKSVIGILKLCSPFILVLSVYFMNEYYHDYLYLNSEIHHTIKEIKEGRGGKHYFYSKEAYLVEDDIFAERNLNLINVGDSIFKKEKDYTLSIYRRSQDSSKLFYNLKYKRVF